MPNRLTLVTAAVSAKEAEMSNSALRLKFVFDDGGRTAAGYKGKTGDCVCRAIAIVTGRPYQEVYDALNAEAEKGRRSKRKRGRSSARTGVHKGTSHRYLKRLGFTWHPTMFVGQGCKIHLVAGELPRGALLVAVSRHLTAVVDGVIHDTYDPSRGGKRCVYGYYIAPAVPTTASSKTVGAHQPDQYVGGGDNA